MMVSKVSWKRGRGKLGFLDPLLGTWKAEAESPAGPIECTRTFIRVLDGKYIQLTALWKIAPKDYEEIAYIGVGPDKMVGFWSFTSDGKQSQGCAADVTDIHPLAVGFEAQMPGGLARMAYWPDEVSGIHWVVESKTQKGWNRFTHHHYFSV